MARLPAVVAAILAAQLVFAVSPTLGQRRSFVLPLHTRADDNVDIANLSPHRRTLLRNATLPLHGAVKDYGYFYASLYLGTPPKKFTVIVDSGSTMTYVPCATCGSNCGPNHQDAAFDPRLSSTSHLIPCSSDKCRCGTPHCACSDSQQCMYTRSYAEQSSSSGILIEDVVSLHDGGAGASIIFGCETRETGEIFKQRADGLFGLGNSDASVVNQLVAAGEIDDVFSLCFGVVEGDGVLMLGDSPAAAEVQMQYTPLVPSPTHPFYYNVRVDAVSVGGKRLDVPPDIFEEGYAAVLDSGTTFTYFPTAVFRAFADAVESHAMSQGLTRVRGPDPQYDDICFGGAPEHTDEAALKAVFPQFSLHFPPDVELTLSPLNYLFVHTFNSGKYCLGIFDNGRAGTLLGGITFRNVLVQYDRANRRIGFGSAPCRDLGQRYRPPCSTFAAEGDELAAVVAVADGDCVPDASGGGAGGRQQAETTTTGGFHTSHGDSGDAEDDYSGHEVLMPVDRTSDPGAGATMVEVEEGEDTYMDASAHDGAMHEGGPDDADHDERPGSSSSGGGGDGGGDSGSSDDARGNAVVPIHNDAVGKQQQNWEGQQLPDADVDADVELHSEAIGPSATRASDTIAAIHVNDDDDDDDDDVIVGVEEEETPTTRAGSSGERNHPIVPSPIALGMLIAVIAMMSVVFVAALFRPSSREAIRGCLPSLWKYQPLDENDPEDGRKYSGAIDRINIGAKAASSAGGGSTAGASVGSVGLTAVLGTGGVAAKAVPSVSVIAMSELPSSKATGASGELRVGLTTPQKLQRTNSNATGAAAAALAEELAASQGHTPRGAGGRPSTPTRMQL